MTLIQPLQCLRQQLRIASVFCQDCVRPFPQCAGRTPTEFMDSLHCEQCFIKFPVVSTASAARQRAPHRNFQFVANAAVFGQRVQDNRSRIPDVQLQKQPVHRTTKQLRAVVNACSTEKGCQSPLRPWGAQSPTVLRCKLEDICVRQLLQTIPGWLPGSRADSREMSHPQRSNLRQVQGSGFRNCRVG